MYLLVLSWIVAQQYDGFHIATSCYISKVEVIYIQRCAARNAHSYFCSSCSPSLSLLLFFPPTPILKPSLLPSLPPCLSVCLFLSVCLSVCLFVFLSVSVCVFLSVYLSVSLQHKTIVSLNLLCSFRSSPILHKVPLNWQNVTFQLPSFLTQKCQLKNTQTRFVIPHQRSGKAYQRVQRYIVHSQQLLFIESGKGVTGRG